jgi:hypothetical protein
MEITHMGLLDTFTGLFAYPIEQRTVHHDQQGAPIQEVGQTPDVFQTMGARTGRPLSERELDRLAVAVCGRTYDGRTAKDLGMKPRRIRRRIADDASWKY